MEVINEKELQPLFEKGPKIVIDSLLNLLKSLQSNYIEVQEECLHLKKQNPKKPKLSFSRTIDIDIPPEQNNSQQQAFTLQKLREAIIQYSKQSESTHQQYKNTINQMMEENTELKQEIQKLESNLITYRAKAPKQNYPEGVLTPLGSSKHRLLKVPQTQIPQSKQIFARERRNLDTDTIINSPSPSKPKYSNISSNDQIKNFKSPPQSPSPRKQSPNHFVTPHKGSST